MEEKLRGKVTLTFSKEVMEGEQEMDVQTRAKANMERVIYETKGFSHIWDLLKKHNPIFIGHNCLLDILFMFSHFDDFLPDSFRSWHNYFGQSFPK